MRKTPPPAARPRASSSGGPCVAGYHGTDRRSSDGSSDEAEGSVFEKSTKTCFARAVDEEATHEPSGSADDANASRIAARKSSGRSRVRASVTEDPLFDPLFDHAPPTTRGNTSAREGRGGATETTEPSATARASGSAAAVNSADVARDSRARARAYASSANVTRGGALSNATPPTTRRATAAGSTSKGTEESKGRVLGSESEPRARMSAGENSPNATAGALGRVAADADSGA